MGYNDADFTNVSALQQDMLALSTWLKKSPEITLNERRKLKMFKHLPNKSMHKIYVSNSWMPLDELNMTPDNTDDAIDKLNAGGLNPYGVQQ